MSPLRIVFPPRKSTRPNSSRFLNNVTVADVEPSQEGRGLPQYTAGACRHGTGGPPPREKLVPGTSGPLSHIMLMAFGVAPLLSRSAETIRRWKMLASGKPGTWYCPNVAFITSDDVPPNVTILLLLCESFNPSRTSAFAERNASALSSSSTPLLSTSPMFWNCTPGKPSEGSAGTCTSASFVCLRYHVNSNPSRSPRNDASRPASSSCPTSGFRSALPRFCGVSVGTPLAPVSGA